MGRASHSVAVVLLVMMMTVGTSHCMMSNKTFGAGSTIVSTTTAGNSSIGAALAWCEGYIIDGQCDLIIPEEYGGDGERLEYSNRQMDMMLQLVEYAYGSSAESNRRVLATGDVNLGDKANNGNSQACTNSERDEAYPPSCHDKPGTGPKPSCPKDAPATRRDCYKSS